MKRLMFIIVSITGMLIPFAVRAQEMQVESFNVVPFDLSATTHKRIDNNGNACALIKVELPMEGAVFEGNIVGDVRYDSGEYWVYLTSGSKHIKIKHPQKRPLMVSFNDFGINIEGSQTYQISVMSELGTEKVTFRISPKDAILTVDQKEYPTDNGNVTLDLTTEEHNYTIFAPGYITQGNKFMVYSGQTNKIIIELDPKEDNTRNTIIQTADGSNTQPHINQTNSSSSNSSSSLATESPGTIFNRINKTQELARKESQQKKSFVDPVIQNLINNMVYVEGGSFMMGSDDSDASDDEKPVHRETVGSFSIGKYEVTQKEWKAVMGNNPSELKGEDLPVYNVSWNDCQNFIKKLNKLTGMKFRLPSEEEWEYAARGGKQSNGYKYSGSNDINRVAWHAENSRDSEKKIFRLHKVGTKEPNELGLHDMSGNIAEWTSSRWSEDSDSQRNGNNYIITRGGAVNHTTQA